MADELPNPPDDHAPVPEASDLVGVPKRTTYRWLEMGRLRGRTVDGQTLVSVSAVRALAAARDAGNGPGSAAPAPALAPTRGTPAPAVLDGDLAAVLFAAFREGETPNSLVERLHILPSVAKAAHKEFTELETMGRSKSRAESRMEALEHRVEALAQELREATWDGVISGEVGSLKRAMEDVHASLKGLAAPHREDFTCTCGAKGMVAVHAKCTACGSVSDWGFYPSK